MIPSIFLLVGTIFSCDPYFVINYSDYSITPENGSISVGSTIKLFVSIPAAYSSGESYEAYLSIGSGFTAEDVAFTIRQGAENAVYENGLYRSFNFVKVDADHVLELTIAPQKAGDLSIFNTNKWF